MGRLTSELCGIPLDNPVIPASGTFGYGYEFAELYDINILGTFSFKGTTAEGVYDSDPRKNPNAKFIREATYQQVIDMNLKIMDPTAFMLCREQKVPEIRIFKMDCLENILKVADGEAIGSVVRA